MNTYAYGIFKGTEVPEEKFPKEAQTDRQMVLTRGLHVAVNDLAVDFVDSTHTWQPDKKCDTHYKIGCGVIQNKSRRRRITHLQCPLNLFVSCSYFSVKIA